MKLIKMTDFVLEQMNEVMLDGTGAVCARIGNYANFLNRPIELGMFFPCDENGRILEKPIIEDEWCNKDSADAEQSFKQKKHCYEQAKERVLFDGFCLDEYRNVCYMSQEILHESELKHSDIEFLINEVVEGISLTQSALKQI